MAQKPRAPRVAKAKKNDATAAASVTENGNDPSQTPTVGHNGMEASFRDWCRRCASARQDVTTEKSKVDTAREGLNRANGFYRKQLGLAKKDGHNPDDIIWWLNNKDRDPAEIDRETRNRTRIARIMELPIGTQLGLLEDGMTVATAIDNDKAVTTAEIDQIKELGFRAGKAGKPAIENPYLDKEGSPEDLAWAGGWRDGQAENMGPLAGKTNGAGAAATH